ncbi:MAG: hypothetical protein LQ346_006572 [Caloplaca aetnensis]|nr:MAG: hypothetical protein LQ346_006572 [Caloplaca aetnensis]
MPLGDSITAGFPGNPNLPGRPYNSYRKHLSELLDDDGLAVEFVGSHKDGDFANNRHEGLSGAKISAISVNADKTLPQRPNVVLLHAGTNDIGVSPNAPQQLDNLIDKILSQCPDAVVLVASIIHRGDPTIDATTAEYNVEVGKIVQNHQLIMGHHVYLVDQYTAIGPDDLTDKIHPTPAGYDKMAEVWRLAIQQVISMGWITDPVPRTGGPGSNDFCTGKLFWNPFGELLNGAGLGPDLDQDGTHAVTFADLNGDGRDDFIWIGPNGEVTAFVNGGLAADGHWIWYPQPALIAGGVGGKRSEIQFADLNGDGRAEYLWVHEDGSIDVWLNQQGSDESTTTLAINWNQQTRSAKGIGRDGAGVRFADLNGDGRAEYIYVQDDGSLLVYLNTGSQDSGPNAGVINWSLQTQTSAGIASARSQTVLADINGDGQSDYLRVSRTDGSVDESMNNGGQDTGPNAAVINWTPLSTPITNGGGTSGRGTIFADINGDGRADFLDVNPSNSAVNMWLNGCDMR